MAKCDALSWDVAISRTKVTAALTFSDFEQSHRFVLMLTKFIQAERGPPQILEGIAWYCPPRES